MSTPKTPIPEIIESEIAFHGFFDVRIDHLQAKQGLQRPYSVVDLGVNAVTVLAKTTEGKFVLTQEYRHPTRLWILGCPGGRIDIGESPIETARRELLEETGYGKGSFSLMNHVLPLPALTNHQIYYVFAQDVEFIQPPALEPLEFIHTLLKDEKELSHEISQQKVLDGILCTALFLKNFLKF